MPIHTIRHTRPAIEIIRQGRILLVDERADELKRLEAILAAEGHRVKQCSSYAEAINHLTDESFDMVLIGQGSGFNEEREVAEWARAVDSQLPVVMLLRDNKVPEDGNQWSGDVSEYVMKPVSAVEERQLKETVRRHLKPRVALVIGFENLS